MSGFIVALWLEDEQETAVLSNNLERSSSDSESPGSSLSSVLGKRKAEESADVSLSSRKVARTEERIHLIVRETALKCDVIIILMFAGTRS